MNKTWIMLGKAYEKGDAHNNMKSIVYYTGIEHKCICMAVKKLWEEGVINTKTYESMKQKLSVDINEPHKVDGFHTTGPWDGFLCPCYQEYLPVRALQCYFYAMEAQYEKRILGRLRRKRKKTKF